MARPRASQNEDKPSTSKKAPANKKENVSNSKPDMPEKKETVGKTSKSKKGDNENAKANGIKAKVKKGPPPVPVRPPTAEEENEDPVVERRQMEGNILRCLDLLQYGPRKDSGLIMKNVRNSLVNRTIQNLTGADYAGKFIRRITSLTWHEKYPYTLASASKFGDILFITGVPNGDREDHDGAPVKFLTKSEIKGAGAGASITAMKFHDREQHFLYRSSIDCTVAKVDLERRTTSVYHDTKDYNRWFCSLDVNFGRNMIVSGDNRGFAFQFSLDGQLVNRWHLHTNKIHHFEFSKKDPNLLVSCPLGKLVGVKIWDIRCMRKSDDGDLMEPVQTLDHNVGINCARFSPLDGSRLMTSDQLDEIRIYQGPLWTDYLTIKHFHKQFQHITPIKADWHPVNDYIVIGRYPPNSGKKPKSFEGPRIARAIEFFDSYTGKFVDAIYPPLDEICSLNSFNPTGEYLATGMNSKLILWRPGVPLDVSENFKGKPSKSAEISEATRNLLRGRRAREYSPVSDDDENEDDANEPPKKKTKTKSTAKTTTSTDTQKQTADKPGTAGSKKSSKRK